MLSLFMGMELNETNKFEQPVKPANTNQINRPELKIFEKQGELVRESLSMQFSNAQTHADLNGRDRFTSARKR